MEGLLSTGSTLSSFLIAIQMDLHQLVLVNFLETLQDTKHLAVSKKLLLAPDIVCCLLCVKELLKSGTHRGRQAQTFILLHLFY